MPIEVVTNGNPAPRRPEALTVAKDGRDFAHLIESVDHVLSEADMRIVHFKMTNGYTVSVIQGIGTYGGREGLFEMGISDPDGNLDYNTPTCPDDVVGWLSNAQVIEKMRRFANFTAEDLERYKAWKQWKATMQEVATLKDNLTGLWISASGEQIHDENDLSFHLRKALESVDKAFRPLAPEDPGIEDDVE